MTFSVGDDVYVVSVADTGAVTETAESPMNTVQYDEVSGFGDHHDKDLRSLPFRGRIYFAGFYYIISAAKENGRRGHETICIGNGRGRIFVKKSRKR